MSTPATKHTEGCKRAFARLDSGCPRCRELQEGAAPRKGWGRRKRHDAQRVREIRQHSCAAAQCGPVCTYGEW
jgi:hypothetical protein